MVSTVSSWDAAAPYPNPAPLVSRHGDRTVVWLEGEQDIATVSVLADTLERAISGGDGDVIVDLSGVTFIDTTTIDALVRRRDALRLQARNLTLRAPPRCARRVLQVCGLSGLVEPVLGEA